MNKNITLRSQNKIIIFIDYRNQFYSSLRVSTGGMDIEKLRIKFESLGLECIIKNYSDFNPKDRFDNVFVLYQSSEDRDLFYKSYIGDIIRIVEQRGGILIPNLSYFEAHENKVYQSYLVSNVNVPNLYIPSSVTFGCYEEILVSNTDLNYPVVIKSSTGCQSKSVALAKSRKELLKVAKKMSSSINIKDALSFAVKKIVKKGYIKESSYRRKFVIQEFIPELKGDYKVLVYGNRVYVLQRKNRPNDFRASGSGIFVFDENVPSILLNVAKDLKEYFNCPCISVDIAFDEKKQLCFLIEIQFLMFGTYTLEKSPFYFANENGEWTTIYEESILENVFAESVANFIEKNNFFLSV